MNSHTRFWDNQALSYSKKPIENLPAYERKVALTKERLRPEHRLLDIGCGTGSLALELAPHVAHAHALDFSKGMIDIARSKAEKGNVKNVTFYESTLDGPAQFEAESFDCVCAYNILHLVPDRQKALAQIFSLLRPGGVFVSSTLCLGESWIPFSAVIAVMRRLGKAPPVQVVDIRAVKGEVIQAGFVDLETPEVGAHARTLFALAQKPQ